ncbi:MAG: glutamine synthetase family protein [Alphaproteobacteria bacterium]
MGKRFHVDFFIDSAWEETHSCNYLLATDIEMHPVDGYAATSWAHGYGDYAMKPDLETLRLIPWLEGTALVLCDVLDHHTHAPVPHSPRAILRAQVARLEKMGIRAMVATELEFFLFRETFAEVAAKISAEISSGAKLTPISDYNEDYHIFQTTKEENIMRALRNGLNGADVPVENSKGEAEAGQEEINIRYTDALTMADRHSIVKNATKEIAWAQGNAATFMAKWSHQRAGSSSHIHQSLQALDGTPLFYDKNDAHGMSDTMRHYLAGLLAHASEITFFLAPNVNSYKRFTSATFAPTKAVWSLDNRTAGYRVCAPNTEAVRVECRVGGSDLNPYLAIAALLAAGIEGIEKSHALEEMFQGDAYEGAGREIPKTLRDATKVLRDSEMLRSAFGSEVVDHYVHAAEWEQAEFDRHVTDWELRRNFERS